MFKRISNNLRFARKFKSAGHTSNALYDDVRTRILGKANQTNEKGTATASGHDEFSVVIVLRVSSSLRIISPNFYCGKSLICGKFALNVVDKDNTARFRGSAYIYPRVGSFVAVIRRNLWKGCPCVFIPTIFQESGGGFPPPRPKLGSVTGHRSSTSRIRDFGLFFVFSAFERTIQTAKLQNFGGHFYRFPYASPCT